MTVNGKTIGENVRQAECHRREVIRTGLGDPLASPKAAPRSSTATSRPMERSSSKPPPRRIC